MIFQIVKLSVYRLYHQACNPSGARYTSPASSHSSPAISNSSPTYHVLARLVHTTHGCCACASTGDVVMPRTAGYVSPGCSRQCVRTPFSHDAVKNRQSLCNIAQLCTICAKPCVRVFSFRTRKMTTSNYAQPILIKQTCAKHCKICAKSV